MKYRISARITAAIFSAALVVPARFAAQDQPHQRPIHYRVFDLGTLGGTVSSGNTINNRGWVMGSSNETGDNVQIATLWRDGQQIPLGTLGGPSSNIGWPVKNNFGLISGITENGVPDPLGETFSCPAFGFGSGNSCVAFAWHDGKMTQLPGLGGNNSIGAGNNNLGQIVGWAESAVHDPTCVSGGGLVQFLQFEAVIWEHKDGDWHAKQLPPYPGDPDSAATAINDRGQVVGISGACDVAIGAFSAIHAVLWEDGKPIKMDTLGGSGWNTPTAINNHGVAAGFDNTPPDIINGKLQISFRAFTWSKEDGVTNLGTLRNSSGQLDALSEATDINDENQVVGVSFQGADFSGPRAFIYQEGTITALNDLLTKSAKANFFVFSTGGINNRGAIGAQAFLVSNGVVTSVAHAVLLIPTDDRDDDDDGNAQSVMMPDDVLKQSQGRVGMGHLLGPPKPQ
jgi:probable HAF family extracellular repeat protein